MAKKYHIPSLAEFTKQARLGSRRFRLPLVAELANDHETPVSLYQNFTSEKYSFLLESVERGEKWGRFSFIGLYPSAVFRSHGTHQASDPLEGLKKAMNRYPFVSSEDLGPFPGGAVGMVSYDMVRFFEKIPKKNKDDLKCPELYFIIPQILLMTDNVKKTLKIVYDARIENRASIKKEYQRGVTLIQKVIRSLKKRKKRPIKKGSALQWTQNLSEKEHAEGVERIREYIKAGDITQAVFSIRFQAKGKPDPLTLYRAFCQVNPSPYMFLIRFDDLTLVGASPETMVRLEKGEMTLRPIAGTRRRGRDEADDQAMEKELLADEKERAEHIMLVDLGRNDLGRVAQPGTVRVEKQMIIERYSHVMHIVSEVRAQLLPDQDAFDLLRATFPAGTLSGSPKVRAMQIIEELEPVRRGFYGGCVGYFGFSGNMDMAITIRSALLYQGKITVQAGGGIVADSQPKLEYLEIMNKSKAVKKAVELCC